MMQFRDKLLKKLKMMPDTATKLLYKQFRYRVANDLTKSKKSYFHDYLNVNSNHMKLLWIGIKSIINIKSSYVNVVNKLNHTKGNLTTDSINVTNIFNTFFVKVADGITKRIPRPPRSPLDYGGSVNTHSLCISAAAPCEISDIIDLFKSNT